MSNHEVLPFGGFTATEEACVGTGDAFGFTADVVLYDAATRTYVPLGEPPSPNADARPACFAEELYFLGGEPAKRQRSGSVFIADLAGLHTRRHKPPRGEKERAT